MKMIFVNILEVKSSHLSLSKDSFSICGYPRYVLVMKTFGIWYVGNDVGLEFHRPAFEL